ncbi:MAG: redox-regulated ATPase YchF [Anaerolineae bacterium]|nr:redox-regulated ATPase YchF [Anaerolineae bacterium]MCB0231435.1 redox-regulated ATPase YchF [Anaerolineae bacterium]MCB0248272.1 redox-regulated ATPase YchF [Anaerolineae bacterium]MCB9129744.1 redox-regulated ATPase YchF [Anaerolineales bacterium]
MELGIIGLPNSSKTTIFNALTRGEAPTSSGSSGKLEFNTAVVDVPDVRVDRLSDMFKPRKTVYAKVTYTDIAGLDQGMAKKGFSGELRNRIARMDAFVHVVRAFADESVPHPLTGINPQRDLSILDEEMVLVDLLAIQTRIERIGESLRRAKKGSEEQIALEIEEALMTRLSDHLETGAPLRDMDLSEDELHSIRSFTFLTLKPVLVLLNTGDDVVPPETLVSYDHRHTVVMAVQGKLEMEIAQLDPDEAAVFMEEFGITEQALDRMIRASYDLVGLQSFFTVGEDEVRAWTVRKGATAVEAAGAIHTDLARGFIRAEVVTYDDLMTTGSMAEARKAGKARLEGKEYLVQDGDILHVRFAL